MFVKDLRLIMLFDFYGELLTQTQKTMFDYYYPRAVLMTIAPGFMAANACAFSK